MHEHRGEPSEPRAMQGGGMNLYRVPRGGYMADKGLSFVCDICSSFTCLYWFVLVCTGLQWLVGAVEESQLCCSVSQLYLHQ